MIDQEQLKKREEEYVKMSPEERRIAREEWWQWYEGLSVEEKIAVQIEAYGLDLHLARKKVLKSEAEEKWANLNPITNEQADRIIELLEQIAFQTS